ncbi:MAG: ketoacyl-ACP synthase III [Bacteriovoracaceae bacterium]|nr:ketoacyl-ACP synthase III [Bacteriovoracaceae bacterium]
MYKSKITGTGSYLPKKIMTNEDLSKIVETSSEWILERTGIETRYIADTKNGESNSDMAAIACKKAMDMAGVEAKDIEMIVFGTCTPDRRLPHASAELQRKLGIENECACFDLGAACSGFVYGMTIADNFIKTGTYKNILVVGAEVLSSIVDWSDRGTCILFGDGAGAVVLGRADENETSEVLGATLGCDGSGTEYLKIETGGSSSPLTHEDIDAKNNFIQMEGRTVFKYATRTMIGNAMKLLDQSKMEPNDVDWYIPHQANIRIIEYIAKKLRLQDGKCVVTVNKYGNNSSATIPIAIDEAIRDGRIKRGQTVMLDAFGAGVTTGAVLFRF